ncbi:hypothetical protein SAMN02745164_00254 [Marinitoga hydrogenitolerans DSM 16785]|uniref:Uncharacterized protein n=1 Tax=Marinitoga hydrogenitolerans (strain DSM 16785 / JCM 12826 / AT1271) TaxID=1122195 RepID=A0A1M4SPD1_MARH1|nr:hypothetical protein [Marinitoga hydrogenitolerans]SHE34051.1 hypothetical protein SAMN02745164_00254 [Marinitoga hydrogenitolerans DSM 16785]
MFFDDFDDLDGIDDFDKLFEKLNKVEQQCPDCLECGYCCKHTPCYYGKWNEEKNQCEYLTEDNKCAKYNEIVEYESKLNLKVKMFGSGCCLNYLNPVRLNKLKKLKENNESI